MPDVTRCASGAQVLKGGDLICEGFIRASKAAPKALVAAPASAAEAEAQAAIANGPIEEVAEMIPKEEVTRPGALHLPDTMLVRAAPVLRCHRLGWETLASSSRAWCQHLVPAVRRSCTAAASPAMASPARARQRQGPAAAVAHLRPKLARRQSPPRALQMKGRQRKGQSM